MSLPIGLENMTAEDGCEHVRQILAAAAPRFNIGDKARYVSSGKDDFASMEGVVVNVRLVECWSMPSYYRIELRPNWDSHNFLEGHERRFEPC